MKLRNIIVVLLTVLLVSACTTQKTLTYFQGIDDPAVVKQLNRSFQSKGEVRIAAGDALVILVTAIDPNAVAPFNMPSVMYSSPTSDEIRTTPMLVHYMVDSTGFINFPVLGKIHLAGKTKSEATAYLEGRISASVKDPIVTINFLNFNVSVVGEVNRPGEFRVESERITVIEAIARAGDLTPYGKRNTVRVVREQDGELQCGTINLNSPDLFTSPFYYLKQNDIVYVEPNGVRAMNSQNIGTYLSMATTAASMATVIISVVALTNK